MTWYGVTGNSNADDDFAWAKECPGGGYALAGMIGRNGGGDAWLVRTNSSGGRLWQRFYGGGGLDWAEFVDQTADGGFIIAGNTMSYGAGGRDFWLIRIDVNGNMLWNQTWGTAGNDECLAAIIDEAGEYVLAGYSGTPWDMALVKFNDAGELLWDTTFGGPDDECCYALLQTSDNGYLLGGITESLGSGNGDVWLVKTGREGPRGNVTLQVAGPTDWDYRLHWVSGFVNRLVFRNLCSGTHGSCADDAYENGWRATDYTDSVVFTSPSPLSSGSLHGFRLYHPQCNCQMTWSAGDNSGTVAGPSPPPPPPCVDYEAEFDRCAEQQKILRGSTVNGGQGCTLRPSQDQGWVISIDHAGLYTFDMCTNAPGGPGAWDSYLYLGTDCCDPNGRIAENDDCPGVTGGQSRIDSVFLGGGGYYLLVEGHDADDQGEYAITITCCSLIPHSDQVDLGDLTVCNYPTLAGNPAHELTGVAWLGAGITAEDSPNLLNQDPNDDGVMFLNPPWTYCETQSVLVTVTAGPNWEQYQQEGGCLFLNAWKDGNMDGDFCDTIDCGNAQAPEWIIQNMRVGAEVAGLVYYAVFLDPGDWRLGHFDGVFRFRLSSRTLGPYGFGLLDTVACPQMTCGTFDRDFLGEVEDYVLSDFQLAVELRSFEAVPGDGQLMLRWITASETDNDYFEIQRDGARVAHVQSQGNSASGHTYSWTDPGLENGVTYTYNLISVDLNGTREDLGQCSATPRENSASITEYALHQNYPNPFNPITNIAFDVVDNNPVTLMVYNATGQIVTALLRDAPYSTGHHVVNYDATNLPSGLYFYTVKIGAEFTSTKKMLLLK
jgi:hypothetical protein